MSPTIEPRPVNSRHPVWATSLQSTVLIEASAGTGKTWTLTGLYLRALTERALTVEQIAVVTFTNSAAAELKQRILARIEQADRALSAVQDAGQTDETDPFIQEWLVEVLKMSVPARDALAIRLKIATASADQMRVSTIHSFCQRLLMMGYGNSVLFSRTELLNSSQALFKQVRDEFFAQVCLHPTYGSIFAQWLAERGSQFERSQEQQRGVLDQRRLQDALHHPLAQAVIDSDSLEALFLQLQASRQALRQLTADQIKEWVEFTNAQPNVSRSSFQSGMRNQVIQTWPGILQSARLMFDDKKTVEMFGRLSWQRQELGLSEEPEPTHPVAVASKNYLIALQAAAGLVGHLGFLFRNYALPRMEQLKREQGIGLPDDFIHLLRESLLRDDVIASALVKDAVQRFPLALVDETQDTDAATWDVLFKLYEQPGGLVAVGDPKQTIYRFRGADVFEYLKAKQRCTEQWSLQENFRSHRNLLQAYNQLFGAQLAFELEGIDYQPALASPRTVAQVFENDRVLPTFQISVDSDSTIYKKPKAEALALQWVVETVQRYLGCRLGSDPLRPGHIAVLVDSHRQAKKVRRALNTVGIAAVEIAKQWVTTTDEADELMLILDALNNPKNKSLVYRALGTRLLEHSDQALAQLRDNPELWQRCLDQLLQTNQLWQQQGCFAALTAFFDYWNTAQRLMCLQSGERRWANIVHLIEMMALESHQCASPLDARQWLAQTRQVNENEVDNEQLLLRLETDQDLVSISTIHASKGLEYDVVLLPFLSDGKELDPEREWPYLYHPGADSEHTATQLRFEFPVQSIYLYRCHTEVRAESARKLYVALTRAKSCCSVFLYNYDKTIEDSPWHRLMARHLQAGEEAQEKFAFATQLALLKRWQEQYPDSFAVTDWRPPINAQANAETVTASTAEPVQLIHYPPPAVQTTMTAPAWIRRPSWVTTSFSGLAHRSQSQFGSVNSEEVWIRDHDATAEVVLTTLIVQATEPTLDSIRWSFPRGEVAGQFLHRAFELQNFAEPFSPSSLQTLSLQFELDADFSATAVWLDTILNETFIGPAQVPIQLRSLVPLARKTELEFTMQVSPTVQLRGFIDLVFQSNGKAYILDWKSNWLGKGAAAYQTSALQLAMQNNQYDLQARIYALAVHRWLSSRLGEQYNYDQHFGGVVYLFLRGVGLEPAAGVHCWRPSLQEMQTLEKRGPL